MKITEELYGADADGNRGIMTYFYELEDTQDEREDIAKCIYEYFTNGDKEVNFEYQNIEISVFVNDYILELTKMLVEDDTFTLEEKVEIIGEYECI